jgi:undecaprenyl diphosphate synthase
MRVRVIGDKSGLSENIIKSINNLEEATKNNTGLNFQVAINYGGRNEIIRAAKSLCLDVNKNITSIDDIDEAVFEHYLDTTGIPDPDLLIRTSGEQRLSNYLLWQLAYTEFYFTEVLWPDFNKAELLKAIEYYNSRIRNFGGVS